MSRVKFTLQPYALEQAANWRLKRGIEIPDNFEGPEFNNVKQLKISDHWVGVKLESGEEYIYPANSIARVAEYPSK